MAIERSTRAPRRRRQRASGMAADMASIRGAIELVATHQARRVILSGLRFGERLMPRAAVEGADLGVDVALDRGREGTSAIVVTLAQG